MEFENQYLDYDEYEELGGNLSEMSFNLLEYQAEKQIDELTCGRFRKLPKNKYPIELKMCTNSLITDLKKYNEVGSKSSESVGSYSVSYDRPVSAEKKKALVNIIKTYLSEVKINDIYVLYCGADINDN